MWQNKRVWIIGASSGVGEALALELARRGATLVLSARKGEVLLRLKERLSGSNHRAMPLDVSHAVEVQQAMQTLLDAKELPDMVFFAAGIYSPMPVSDVDVTLADTIIDVNLKGAIHTIAAVLPHFLKARKGLLALTASVAGYRGLPQSFAYGASKAAIIHMAETLKLETMGTGVDIRVVNPGFVKSQLTDKNPFPMPSIITAEKAAEYILTGLESKNFEIHFPKRFTYGMKFLRYLPYRLYFPLVKKITGM